MVGHIHRYGPVVDNFAGHGARRNFPGWSRREDRLTVRRVVGGGVGFLNVNRVYDTIGNLRDGEKSAWPALTWLDNRENVGLFVLVYLMAGCDFLPAVSALPFGRLWNFTLLSLRSEGLFTSPVLVERHGR